MLPSSEYKRAGYPPYVIENESLKHAFHDLYKTF